MAPPDPVTVKNCLEREQKDSLEATSALLSSLSPQALARRDLALLNLSVLNTSTGFGGRTVIELGPDTSISSIWAPCFKVGDIVRLDVQPKSGQVSKSKNKSESEVTTAIEAVVVSIGRQSLSIAYEKEDLDTLPDSRNRLWLAKLENLSVFNRMKWAIDRISTSPHSGVAQLMLGEAPASVARKTLDFKSASLNESQRAAVEYAVGSNLAIIHGPPGTGKTKTIIEVISQLVAQGERVLVCGPSNVSVDNIVERLSPMFAKTPNHLIRLGHPARVSDAALSHSVDLLSKTSNEGQVIRELQTEITNTLRGALGKVKTTLPGGKREAFKLLKDLRKDYRNRESRLMQALLYSAKVVAATLHTAGSKEIGAAAPLFDTVIIDEVSQALLPQCWIPAVVDSRPHRLIVAGDNKQLPPTISSKDAKVSKVLQKTLFDVLLEYHGQDIKHLLTIQYRMSERIMAFPSLAMYDNKLTADVSVAQNSLPDLAHVLENDTTASKVLWIDTAPNAFNYEEQREEEGFSLRNEGEVKLVVEYIHKLLSSGVAANDIGVIAPYSAQVGTLRQRIVSPEIEVHTVDGFQGREKEVIILTLVRSNDQNEVGFVADERRINVAITRPKRQLCIVGNSDVLKHNKGFLRKWVDWCGDNADIEYAE